MSGRTSPQSDSLPRELKNPPPPVGDHGLGLGLGIGLGLGLGLGLDLDLGLGLGLGLDHVRGRYACEHPYRRGIATRHHHR